MGGNVWQWCEDWYDASQKDRIFRGAAWNSFVRFELRSSHRRHTGQYARTNDYGFRCVLILD